jgi:hypothetical protein
MLVGALFDDAVFDDAVPQGVPSTAHIREPPPTAIS